MCYLKIDELKVNSYGKLKNKDIKFSICRIVLKNVKKFLLTNGLKASIMLDVVANVES